MTRGRRRFPLTRFALTAFVVFGLLVVPWTPLRAAAAAVFRALAGASFGIAGFGDRVGFRAQAMRVSSPATGEYWDVPCDEFVIGFLPVAILVALVVASPVPWRGRLRTLALGGMLVWAYVLLRLGAMLWIGFADHSKSCPGAHRGAVDLTPGGLGARWVAALTTFHLEPMVYFTIPLLIWAAVALRGPLLARLLGRDDAEGAGDGAALRSRSTRAGT